MWGNIAIAFVLSFITAFMATPYTIKLANKIGAVDVPKDKRRMRKIWWTSCNIRFFSRDNISFNYNEY